VCLHEGSRGRSSVSPTTHHDPRRPWLCPRRSRPQPTKRYGTSSPRPPLKILAAAERGRRRKKTCSGSRVLLPATSMARCPSVRCRSAASASPSSRDHQGALRLVASRKQVFSEACHLGPHGKEPRYVLRVYARCSRCPSPTWSAQGSPFLSSPHPTWPLGGFGEYG
jgi:hypothetical protein